MVAEALFGMFQPEENPASISEEEPFERLIRQLGEKFLVRDVMVPINHLESVKPGEEEEAIRIIEQRRYSVIPISKDKKNFKSVFCAEKKTNAVWGISRERKIDVSDYIPDLTPLAEAFYLFRAREWYFTLRANHVSGLITYWAFNSREFRVQIYAGLSRVEELSRNVLAGEGCGITDENGLNLTKKVIEKISGRTRPAWQNNGGNRFVDELDYRQVHRALSKLQPWRTFLNGRLGCDISNSDYGRHFNFIDLRNAVMHGRTVFPTHEDFRKDSLIIGNIGEFINHLDAYLASKRG